MHTHTHGTFCVGAKFAQESRRTIHVSQKCIILICRYASSRNCQIYKMRASEQLASRKKDLNKTPLMHNSNASIVCVCECVCRVGIWIGCYNHINARSACRHCQKNNWPDRIRAEIAHHWYIDLAICSGIVRLFGSGPIVGREDWGGFGFRRKRRASTGDTSRTQHARTGT